MRAVTSAPNLSRGIFVGGLGTSILAACSPTLRTTPPHISTAAFDGLTPSLLSKAGVLGVTKDGLVYTRTGRIVAVSGSRSSLTASGGGSTDSNCGDSTLASAQRSTLSCDDGSSDGAIDFNGADPSFVIGSTSVTFIPPNTPTTIGFEANEYGGDYGYPYLAKGPGIAVPNSTGNSCGVALAAAANAASAMALQIINNSSRYSGAIVQAAQNAINQWQQTGYGVAAAIQFLGFLAATLSASELLSLVVLVGSTVAIIYFAIVCFYG